MGILHFLVFPAHSNKRLM